MFSNYHLKYDEPLFRPPGEAASLILQVTLGCSWNRCSFCEMYTSKQFRARPEDEVLDEIRIAGKLAADTRKIFLADGNPMVLSFSRLASILTTIKESFPKVRRITTYALPRDILAKSPAELLQLKELGLNQLYIGIESGDDELLKIINKGESYSSTVEGLLKAKEAGMKLSVIILNGLGGMKYSEQHAISSAKILNEIQPEFVSSLVLSFPYGLDHFTKKFGGDYQPMGIIDLLKETELFISGTELTNSIYRSNHASNYLVLSGVLSKDKENFLRQISFAINNPEVAGLWEEWQRGL